MGIRTLAGTYDGTAGIERAVMVDSVTETAFGPLFASAEELEKFLRVYRQTFGGDPREADGETLRALLLLIRTGESA